MPARQLVATRQELLKLKTRTKSAKRGHSLLKDKRDSLMKQLFETMRQAHLLRTKFDQEYHQLYSQFQLANAQIDPKYLASLAETVTVNLNLFTKMENLMSVKIPKFESQVEGSPTQYSLVQTNAELDSSLSGLRQLIPDILKLIAIEHKALLLAKEIEKTRRRVNSLEYVIIPQLGHETKLVRNKLEEQARDTTTALMKVKQLIEAKEETSS